ncbi:MAG: class I SAM-dependent methyltransferase, partial [Acidobacteriota bacterium]|nr:class I SAM-dependent methyltransferase [Acidobacteriota bacterium]
LDLPQGARVLDLCCGAGASALEAARRVGERGRVVAVDVSSRLLEHARRRAAREGLSNLDFVLSDATRLDVADATFDAVVCVFGVFFAADRPSFVDEMRRLTKPGGRVALTTWGPHLFEPANSIFWDAVGVLRPDLRRSFNPWDDLVTPDDVAALFDENDFHPPHVELIEGVHHLTGPQGF